MPICPKCGKQYRKGGTYTTHVQNCDGEKSGPETAADGGSASLEKEVETLRARLDRLERQTVNTPSNEKLDAAREDAERAVDNVATMGDRLDALSDRLDALSDRLDAVEDESFVFECNECDHRIEMPWREPSKCPSCGTRLDWSAVEKQMRP